MSPENWKLKPPPEISAALTLAPGKGKTLAKFSGKRGDKTAKAKGPTVIQLNIIELTYSGLIAESPKDTVQQGEDIRLRVVVTPPPVITEENLDLPAPVKAKPEILEISAKVARLTLGSAKEDDVVEFSFIEWDRKRWDELKSARSNLQVQVGRVFTALKH